MIYTSGSTGRPKGVLVPHAGIVNRLLWMQSEHPIGSDDRVLQKTPSSFDVSAPEFFWPLITGATLVVARPEGHKDPEYLAELIRRERVTTVSFVPSMLEAFLHTPAAAGCTTLRRVLCSGEALSGSLVNRFHRLLGAEVHNLYGPTEASVEVTHWQSPGGTELVAAPIGRPVANTRAYVLDQALRPMAPGVPGELYLAGAGLAHGYLNRPVLSAERFVADPYGPAGTRMYRTGDVVRREDAGELSYLGRADDQVKIRGFRIELGEIEARLASHPAVAQAAVIAREDTPGVKRLVGYLVPADGADPDPAELRAHVAAALPEYMVPASFLTLPALPLSPSGKLDRRALPAPEFTAAATSRAPRTPDETVLCGLFADTLGVDAVGIDDSFFDLGGDSIISIQLAARARKHGLGLTPRDIFTHRTVAALAAVAGDAPAVTAEGPDAGIGALRLLPITHWLRERGGPMAEFNQSALVHAPAGLDLPRLATTVQALLDRHDALRLRLTGPPGGDWSAEVAPRGGVSAANCLARVDATDLDASGLERAVATAALAAQRQLAPAEGQLLRVVWFDAGPARPGRLLLLIHHLAVDGVSWRILLPDLASAWDAVAAGRAPELEPVPTSLRTWSERLARAALEPARTAELPLWQRILDGPDPLLTDRPLDPGQDVYRTNRTLTLTLPPEVTEPLLTTVPAAFHAGANDVLLTGLALAVAAWRQQRGLGDGTDVLLDLEGHGREEIAADLDLSRTVGWFTSLFPVRLDSGVTDWDEVWAGGPELGRALKSVKEQLRALPDHGLGYGMLRHLNPETAPLLAAAPGPQIGFNYLGRFTGAQAGDAAGDAQAGDWAPAAEADAIGPAVDPGLPLPHAVEVNAVTEERADGPRLLATWSWGGLLLAEEQLRELAELWFRALRALVAHAAVPGAGGRTPSDFPLLTLDQNELEELESRWQEFGLEDVLPLAPLQEGLLFHALYDTDAIDVYNIQTVFDLTGPLRPHDLKTACHATIQRHPALRAAYTQRPNGQPIQTITHTTPLPWTTLNLTHQPHTLNTHLHHDRIQRFTTNQPPLLRFTLIQLNPHHHLLLFTCHHLLLDGWSLPLIAHDLFHHYTHGNHNQLPPPTPHRNHLHWLTTQNHTTAENAWRTHLHNLHQPTLIAPPNHTTTTLPHRHTTTLTTHHTTTLTHTARTHSHTLNTLLQTAWALTLTTLTNQTDLVFGTTVSGRPPELPDIENIVGLLINTIPTRITLHPHETLNQLLTRTQNQQTALTPHQHLPLNHIQRLTPHPELFDTTTVFQNYPKSGAGTELPGTGLTVAGIEGIDAYHYPLKLSAQPGPCLQLDLDYLPEQFTRAQAEYLGELVRRVLTAFAEDPEVLVGELTARFRAEHAPHRDAFQQPARSRRPAVAAAPGEHPAPPGTPTEELLCRLFRDLLDVEHLGVDEDFFERGGDSLLALRLVHRIGTELRTPLDVRVLFDAPTVSGLAKVLDGLT